MVKAPFDCRCWVSKRSEVRRFRRCKDGIHISVNLKIHYVIEAMSKNSLDLSKNIDIHSIGGLTLETIGITFSCNTQS